LEKKEGTKFFISNTQFPIKLFKKVRKGSLSASEVFAIENMEQRRIAYERMNKMKMKELDCKVLDEVKDDGYGHPMKIISFSLKGYDTPFYFLNCFCATTGREYYLETRKQTCIEAKMSSFGLDKEIRFDKEW
jgi:hypothetical protein